MLPKYLKKYFWDVDFSNLDKNESSRFIIERILEHGDMEGISWMWKNFARDKIKDRVLNSRRLSRRSANYWSIVFVLDRSKILVLSDSFQKNRIGWDY